METFRGSPQNPDFQRWLKRVSQIKRAIIAIVTDDIYCYKARTTLEQVSPSPYLAQSPFAKEEFITALIHVITCDRNQQCKQLLQTLRAQLKAS